MSDAKSDTPPRDRWIQAEEACRRLQVKPATLYAYVSRGLVHSRPAESGRRRLYDGEDVLRLMERSRDRRDPESSSRRALAWGGPVLDSSLTLIADRTIHYRGAEVGELARHRTLEEVAALLWLDDRSAAGDLFGGEPNRRAGTLSESELAVTDAHPGDRMQLALRLAAATDDEAYDLRPHRVARTGARVLRALRDAVCADEAGATVATALARSWQAPAVAVPVIDGAMVLCADHELNVSSFTARCVASAGSSPYEVVSAGLAALRGFRHGGCSDRTEALLAELGIGPEMSRPPSRSAIRTVLGRRLEAGTSVPGFGHRLYSEGDPRYQVLLSLLESRLPASWPLSAARVVAEVGQEMLGDQPNIDLGLATVSVVLGVRPGAAWTLFALGRTVGWIAHAIEQYENAQLIRPRARYVGRAPTEDERGQPFRS